MYWYDGQGWHEDQGHQGWHEDQGHQGWLGHGYEHDPGHDCLGQDGQFGQDGQTGQDVEEG